MGKELQTMNHQNKVALWAERISACRTSGQTVKSWCQEHEICEGTFYRWQKILVEMAKSQQHPDFVEVTSLMQTSAEVAVTVRMGGVEADIHSGADSETVGMVLRLLKSC